MVNKIGIFIGRFTPFHVGHQSIIDYMIDKHGYDNCLVLIGSSNTPLSFRVLFDYKTRRRWIKRIYPELRIAGMPDSVGDNTQWFQMLDDYCSLAFPDKELDDFIFYGGCRDDISWYYEHGKQVKLFDRFNGNFDNVSATKIRQIMLQSSSVDEIIQNTSHLIDKRILNEVIEIFNKQLKKLDELR